MELHYLFHSGFAVVSDHIAVVIDFYEDTTDAMTGWLHHVLLPSDKKIYVLSTHFHPDHFNKEILEWKNVHPDIVYLLSNDIKRHHRAHAEDGIFLKKGDVYDDGTVRVKAYGSTDSGDSFLVSLEGKTFFHAGDLNNWHWSGESNPREIKKAENDYLAELKYIMLDVKEVDVTLFPVDRRIGGDYSKGARQFLQNIKSTIFVPMHFGDDYEGGNSFQKDAEKLGVQFVPLTVKGQVIHIE